MQAIVYLYRAKREVRSAFSNPDTPPIIIYQMGKVGSSTVNQSLKESSLPNPIFHLHFISRDIDELRRMYKSAGIYPVPYNFYLGEAIRKIRHRFQEFPVKIISLVRDPIAFIISDLFENPHFADEGLQTDEGLIIPRAAIAYIDRKLQNPKTFNYIYEWFDRELKTVFDIDVFAEPFPIETGYAVYSKGNVEALVIRLEDLSEKGPKALSDFLGLDAPLTLKHRNIRAKSKSNKIYQEVKAHIAMDRSVCENIYASRFMQHFYNDANINRFIENWTASRFNSDTRLG
jgi:hypothetical protein